MDSSASRDASDNPAAEDALSFQACELLRLSSSSYFQTDERHEGSRTHADGEEQRSEGTEASCKIPNRDSGIDSPSCGAEGFPREDRIEEEDRRVTETPGGDKRDSTQDEDSDLDEGSGEESPEVKVRALGAVSVVNVWIHTPCDF